ncbi:16087_t:CDS:2, partial [Cetraspora pellucida]
KSVKKHGELKTHSEKVNALREEVTIQNLIEKKIKYVEHASNSPCIYQFLSMLLDYVLQNIHQVQTQSKVIDRIKAVDKTQAERQQKRTANIQARIDAKK